MISFEYENLKLQQVFYKSTSLVLSENIQGIHVISAYSNRSREALYTLSFYATIGIMIQLLLVFLKNNSFHLYLN